MKLTSRDDAAVRSYQEHLWDRSIPTLLLERAHQDPDRVAIRYKRLGVFQELTWSEYLERVEYVAGGLMSLGLARGDRVAIMGDPSLEWLLTDLGGLCSGAMTFGIYSTCSPDQVAFQIRKAAARVFVAEDQEHLDKLLDSEAADEVESIIVIDDRTLFLYDDARILTFEQLERRGRELLREEPSCVEEEMQAIDADDLAVMTFTSGTTGDPKGVVHTHRDAIVGMTYPYLYFYPELRSFEHRTITHLALAHLVERSMSCWLPLLSDCVPHIGEKRAGLRQLLFEVQPTFFHGVPRIWEKLAAQVHVAVSMSSPIKRRVFESADRFGEPWLQSHWDGRGPSVSQRFLHAACNAVAFKPALHKIGMAELEGGFTAGAPIPEAVQAQWQRWGVSLRNLYGITEGTLVFSQVGSFPDPRRGGIAAHPKEVSLSQRNEVLVGGRGLMTKYWDEPDATEAALVDNHLQTGDVAEQDGNEFRIVDRIKDIMITAGGKNISPAEVENAIKASPYISEVVLIADGRKFPSCLVEVDFDTCAQWATANDVSFTGYTDLVAQPEVEVLIRDEIVRANAHLANVEQPKQFRIMPKELDPEDGDTTPTRKVKRDLMQSMFHDLIEQMYGGGAVGTPPGRVPARGG